MGFALEVLFLALDRRVVDRVSDRERSAGIAQVTNILLERRSDAQFSVHIANLVEHLAILFFSPGIRIDEFLQLRFFRFRAAMMGARLSPWSCPRERFSTLASDLDRAMCFKRDGPIGFAGRVHRRDLPLEEFDNERQSYILLVLQKSRRLMPRRAARVSQQKNESRLRGRPRAQPG